ncbi:MAG TPA: PAS domain S-box protein [Methylomirabilota bacterium]|nr:PAS domain S-box protein [Methylomirabilota bacterium]
MPNSFVCNPARLDALHRFDILDTEREQEFDDLTSLAAYITRCPIALLNFVDCDRQWFKSAIGLNTRETSIKVAICVHTIQQDGLLIIEDTLQDPRLKDNPLLHGTGPIRFYAGAPLRTSDGHAIGTLCVADYVPRKLDLEQASFLQALARQAMAQLNLRNAVTTEQRAHQDLRSREAYLQLQYELSRILNAAGDGDTLSSSLEVICNLLQWDCGSIWLLEEGEDHLTLARHYIRAPRSFPKFTEMTRQKTFRKGEGLPGHVWLHGQAITFADIRQGIGYPRMPIAAEEGLSSCFGFPITGPDNELVGVLEFWSVSRHDPEPELIAALSSFSRQMGQFLLRQSARDQLLRSQRLYKAILSSALDAIVSIDAHGHILEFNPAAERLFGYSREEALGKRMTEMIVPPQHREAHNRGMARFLATGETHVLNRRIEVSAIDSRGREFPIELAIVANGHRPKITFTAFMRDIQDRKALERHREEQNRRLEIEVRERTKALAESNAQLESFAYSVAHDLRAPLRSISGFAEMLEEDFGAALPAEGIDYLGRIKRSARRLDALIQDLLGYSRVGKVDLPLGPVSLDEVTHAALQALSGSINEARAVVSLEEPLGSVVGNKAALQQVFENLISNAVKFTNEREQPRVRIWSTLEEGWRQVFFEDNGIGIRPEHQHKVFKLFERVATEYPGTGVGLAIVAQSVRRMNGSCGLHSLPGAGSTFWVCLPAPDPAAPSKR